jgi:biopolymer transport protein ExbB
METSLGLFSVWNQGDWVTKSVALLLLGMSLASWIVIIVKALDIVQGKKHARAIAAFWRSADYADGLLLLGPQQGNPFCQLAAQGREAATHLQRHDSRAAAQLDHRLDASEWITRALRNSMDESTAALQSGLAVLASVGSTAPFVGLFGTVWGIYHALMGIGLAGQATIDKVAGPIGEALIMTALGLAVAIPAVLGYNALVRGNKSVVQKLNRFAHDLHAYWLTGARVHAGQGNTSSVVAMKHA